ncbi:protein IQ-DOMAIN 2-like [Cornus florida]|uniref:protein IQ-DOMAIN 2-like n=1 Tax=Cornus florida TaxID=4283 RepID=UPI00289AEB36|nr:protein IQ-DOMAIN 2-like [Cornus florida]
MGRKGNWFSSVKKALSPVSKTKKNPNKSKKKSYELEKSAVPNPLPLETVTVSHPPPPLEEVKLAEVQDEQTKHAYSVAVATAVAAEAAVAAAQAAVEVVRLTTVTQFTGKSKEEVAAIRIQTAFRGYLAKRALRALRGLVRLKSLVQGPTVQRQTTHTLRCMQTLSRVQSQVHSRRIRMSEENQALQRQLLQKCATELECLRMGEDWDDSLQSKEQIEANLLSKYEAAMRRERALAYSFSHQQTWKKSTKSANLLFMDPNNPQWGWSWLERWMAARTWDNRSMTEKELNSDLSSVKSIGLSVGEITKAYARHQLNSDKPSPTASQKPSHFSNHPSPSPTGSRKPSHHSNRLSPSTPASKSAFSAVARSTRGDVLGPEDDAKSMFSVKSERNRRHSIAGSLVRDDESLASSPAVPSYMASTKSAKAKSRMQNPLGVENGTPEKGSAGSAKKRLSFPPSPARPRRHSGPPKVDISSIAKQNAVKGGTEDNNKLMIPDEEQKIIS